MPTSATRDEPQVRTKGKEGKNATFTPHQANAERSAQRLALFAAPLAAQAATTSPAWTSHGVLAAVPAVPAGAHWEFTGELFALDDTGLHNCGLRGLYFVDHGAAISYQCIDGDPMQATTTSGSSSIADPL